MSALNTIVLCCRCKKKNCFQLSEAKMIPRL